MPVYIVSTLLVQCREAPDVASDSYGEKSTATVVKTRPEVPVHIVSTLLVKCREEPGGASDYYDEKITATVDGGIARLYMPSISKASPSQP